VRFVLAFALTAAACNLAAAQQFVPCQGPFAHCAKRVHGQCWRDSDGEQVIAYKDQFNAASDFERCASEVYRQRGLVNPYTTGQQSEELPLPRTEAQPYRW
jgi:hypothetical protein